MGGKTPFGDQGRLELFPAFRTKTSWMRASGATLPGRSGWRGARSGRAACGLGEDRGLGPHRTGLGGEIRLSPCWQRARGGPVMPGVPPGQRRPAIWGQPNQQRHQQAGRNHGRGLAKPSHGSHSPVHPCSLLHGTGPAASSATRCPFACPGPLLPHPLTIPRDRPVAKRRSSRWGAGGGLVGVTEPGRSARRRPGNWRVARPDSGPARRSARACPTRGPGQRSGRRR